MTIPDKATAVTWCNGDLSQMVQSNANDWY
jgi:hypothetical protein